MTIVHTHGDILDSPAEAIVIPTNCKGVWGAGLAKQAASRWPTAASLDKHAGNRGDLHIGVCQFYRRIGKSGRMDKWLIALPTKEHWTNFSFIDHVRDGLEDLADQCGRRGIESVAIPPVGCGLGRLAPRHVWPIIEELFRPHTTLAYVYGFATVARAETTTPGDTLDNRWE